MSQEAAPVPVDDIQTRIAAANAAAESYRAAREAEQPNFGDQLTRMEGHLAGAEKAQNTGFVHDEEAAAATPASTQETRESATAIRRGEREHFYRDEMRKFIEDPTDLGPDGDWATADALAKERAAEKMAANAREATALAQEIGLEQDIKHGRMDSANARLDQALTLATGNNDRESWDRFGKFWNMMTPEQREQFSGRPEMTERLSTLFEQAQASDNSEDWARFDRVQMALTDKQKAAFAESRESILSSDENRIERLKGLIDSALAGDADARTEVAELVGGLSTKGKETWLSWTKDRNSANATPGERRTPAGDLIDVDTQDLTGDLEALRLQHDASVMEEMKALHPLALVRDRTAEGEFIGRFNQLSPEGKAAWYQWLAQQKEQSPSAALPPAAEPWQPTLRSTGSYAQPSAPPPAASSGWRTTPLAAPVASFPGASWTDDPDGGMVTRYDVPRYREGLETERRRARGLRRLGELVTFAGLRDTISQAIRDNRERQHRLESEQMFGHTPELAPTPLTGRMLRQQRDLWPIENRRTFEAEANAVADQVEAKAQAALDDRRARALATAEEQTKNREALKARKRQEEEARKRQKQVV